MLQFVQRSFLWGILIVVLSGLSGCRETKKELKIIPKPVTQKILKGKFILGPGTRIIPESNDLRQSAGYLQNFIREKYGIQTKTAEKKPAGDYIRLFITDTISHTEGYVLQVRDKGVEITGSTPAGVFYGIQTFLQMLDPQAGNKEQIAVQAAKIYDHPRFEWRGQHLDVGRHFFSVGFIKNLLDVMAMHKLNTFHWHLTEDQGWRIEIKQYPELTETGAWRDSTLRGQKSVYPPGYNTERYGGYYTQKEIKEVVQYAKERNITVVPEIEMPGHCLAALAAYPEYSCTGGPFEVATEWGVFEDVFCAGKEETFTFLQNILDEVIQLFPGEYIHIGGDEVPKARWSNCKDCQRRIREEGLEDEAELQSYFIKRIEKYLHRKNKKLIGWDEILEGGLPERAVVMSWRGMEGGIEAAGAHHPTIMTPWTPCYFYVYQGKYREPVAGGDCTLLSNVYHFDPVPGELSEAEAKYILGGQGCAWTEYMPDREVAEYMIFPRLSALSEVLWSPKSRMDWQDFLFRMDAQYLRMDYFDINYRVDYPANYGFINRTTNDTVRIKLDNVIHDSEIRYTTDGSEPTKSSPRYTEPFTLALSEERPVTLKSRTFMPNGRKSAVHKGRFEKLKWLDPVSPPAPEAGLRYQYFDKKVLAMDQIKGEPDRTGVTEAVTFPGNTASEFMAMIFEGYIRVPEKAVYEFQVHSSKGKALLFIDQMKVVDNTAALKRYYQKTGKIALNPGYHPFKIKFFTMNDRKKLRLACTYNGKELEEVPASWFFH